MQTELVKKAEQYVVDLLKKGLSADHKYHDLAHTLAVRESVLQLAEAYRLSDEEKELLELAALFHDTGFTARYDEHEEKSKEIAEKYLRSQGVDEEKINQIKQLIEVTKVTVEPNTLLEKLLKDADFNNLSGDYLAKSDALRHEWKVFCGKEMDESAWVENNLNFWKNHKFYTGEGQAKYGEEKRKTLKKLKKRKQEIQNGEQKGDSTGEDLIFTIKKSKSAQMMFKTTLRNQIDLTNIADNKANIMLSINSLLITLGIPLLLPRVMEDTKLLLPTVTLLLTCVLSIVYATMATRPVKMTGITDPSLIDQGKSNLFFFGNFYKMDMETYRKYLHKVLLNDELLDNSIVNDLYFLGRTLGNKYRRLRITYNIFMIGMVLTVIAFGITLLMD
jgi:predicted metal-dependent HD superfamily phosphohydrolase